MQYVMCDVWCMMCDVPDLTFCNILTLWVKGRLKIPKEEVVCTLYLARPLNMLARFSKYFLKDIANMLQLLPVWDHWSRYWLIRRHLRKLLCSKLVANSWGLKNFYSKITTDKYIDILECSGMFSHPWIFTESAPRPIQSSTRNVRVNVCLNECFPLPMHCFLRPLIGPEITWSFSRPLIGHPPPPPPTRGPNS